MKNVKISELGKFIRKIRIDNEETGIQMAERLGVTSSYISAIELGKRDMSNKLKNEFIKRYNLNNNQILELDRLISLERKYLKIETSKMKKEDINLIITLSNKISIMSKEDKEKIKNIIYKKGE